MALFSVTVDLRPGVLENNSGMAKNSGWSNEWGQLVCPLKSASYVKCMNVSSFVCEKGRMVSTLKRKGILGLALHRPGLYRGSVVVKPKTGYCKTFLLYTHLSFTFFFIGIGTGWMFLNV